MEEKKNNNLQYMLEINKQQKNYYEFDTTKEFQHGGNPATRFWDFIRDFQYQMTDDLNMNEELFEIHKKWMGDISNKKVLDLGCHTGNELSIYLAQNSKKYVGIDLSSSAINVLKNKMESLGINNAHFFSEDILSEQFQEKDFDIIYAKAVFHHFKYFDEFVEKISRKLNKNGIVITTDPLNTFLPIKIIRALYRNLQKDKDWEYPFTKHTFQIIEKYFDFKEVAGMMGKTKWAFPIYLLSKKYSIEKGKKWIYDDFYNVKLYDKSLWKCLRVSMKLEKKY